MKKKSSLPVVEPDFICYHHITCSNAILRANLNEEVLNILCSKYINCFFKKESLKHKFVISMYDPWCTVQGLIQTQSLNFLKEVYEREKTNFILLLKKCLLQNLYVFGQCNRTYIEKQEENTTSIYNFMVTGYDDILQEFEIYGLNSSDNFVRNKINYQLFNEALLSTPKQNIWFTLRNFCDRNINSIDWANTAFELEDYINSTNRRYHYKADKIYGLKSYEILAKHFEECASTGELFSMQYLLKIKMHKLYMRDRIAFFITNDVLNNKYLSLAEKVKDIGDEVLNIGEKYNETLDNTYAKLLIRYINMANEIENEYLPYVLKGVSSFKEKTSG